MKCAFNKENRVISMLDDAGRKEKRFYDVLTVVLFLGASFSLWEFLFDFCNMVGAVVSGSPQVAGTQALRQMPLILTAIQYVYMSIWVKRAYTAPSAEARVRTWKVSGAVTAVLGAVIALYVVIGVLTGEYGALVEGYVSPLYPLDTLLGGLLFIVFGVFAIRYAAVLKAKGSRLPCRTDSRGGVRRVFDNIFNFLALLVALCAFAACAFGLFTMDWTHGNLFFNIMLWLNYFSAFAMLVTFRYVVVEVKDELRRETQFKAALCFLIVNIVLFALYLVSVQLQNEAPNLNAFSILPIEFTASFNAFMVIFGLENVIGPLAALLKSLPRKKA